MSVQSQAVVHHPGHPTPPMKRPVSAILPSGRARPCLPSRPPAPDDDPFFWVRRSGIAGPNYDLTNDNIVEILEGWRQRFGLMVLRATRNTLIVRLGRLPADVQAFADEVSEFCPDVIWQDIGGLSGFVDSLRRCPEMLLWWD